METQKWYDGKKTNAELTAACPMFKECEDVMLSLLGLSRKLPKQTKQRMLKKHFRVFTDLLYEEVQGWVLSLDPNELDLEYSRTMFLEEMADRGYFEGPCDCESDQVFMYLEWWDDL